MWRKRCTERSAREETEEAWNDLASMDRQNKHALEEIELQFNTLSETVDDLRSDLNGKPNTLQETQDRLSQKEMEVGHLESEVLRLKAQIGDIETLGSIERELSEQVAHIRQLEKTNREQAEELKMFRRKGKAVEVIKEEKRVIESKLGLLDDTQKRLREAQLQRHIFEDERRSWTAYLENEDGSEYETPEEMAKALVRQRLENASPVQQKGELQAEQLEKDQIIKTFESQHSAVQSELNSMKSSTTTIGTIAAPSSTSTSRPATAVLDSHSKHRLEKQLSFARKDIALMREQLRSFDAEEQTYHPDSNFDAAKSARIADLETMPDEHRKELADLTAEISSIETKLSSTSSLAAAAAKFPLKRTHSSTTSSKNDDDDDDKDSLPLGQLSRTLQDTIATLHATNAIFRQESQA